MATEKQFKTLLKATTKTLSKSGRKLAEKLMLDKLLQWPRTLGELLNYILVAGFLLYCLWNAYKISEVAIHASATKSEIVKLRGEVATYKKGIAADSTIVERLKTDTGLEQFARETHNMRRPNETVYNLK